MGSPTDLHTYSAQRGERMDIDAIPAGVWGVGGAGGMLSLLYWLLVTGRIIVGSVHREQLADKDAQITQLWGTVESLTDSVQKFTVSGEIAAQAFRSVEKTAAHKDGS